jgi:hypothetical protein
MQRGSELRLVVEDDDWWSAIDEGESLPMDGNDSSILSV